MQNELDVLKRQIHHRAQIEKLMFDMHVFFNAHDDLGSEFRWFKINPLIGIAFSLWRACFLTDVTHSEAEVFEHSKIFLEKLVRSNAVTFADDRVSREWSVMYYISNAFFRLENLANINEDFRELPAVAHMLEIAKRESVPSLDGWELLFAALSEIFKKFSSDYKHLKNYKRPKKI
jgi:hypothetical protein